jgi:hypothetical protein
MERMITAATRGFSANYCVECADDDALVRAQSERALCEGDDIQMNDLVFGEVCEQCGRRIREVPAYQRLYLLAANIQIESWLKIPAHESSCRLTIIFLETHELAA